MSNSQTLRKVETQDDELPLWENVCGVSAVLEKGAEFKIGMTATIWLECYIHQQLTLICSPNFSSSLVFLLFS